MQKQFMGVAALGAALAVADAGSAQAVQWRVEDGGNGHWFELVHSPKPAELARSAAGASGGALAVVRSHAQTAFLVQRLFPSSPANSAWIGGFQDFASSEYSEPAGGWMWVDGTPIAGYTNWDPVWTEPNNANTQEDWVEIVRHGTWNDVSRLLERPFIVEWSADCNNDGIIDYGQCRDGSLPDYNSNNIPDCCESEVPCETSNYAVQWRIEDGGNGRWYQALLTSAPILWSDARDAARSRGGD